jgi:hypothetical protein
LEAGFMSSICNWYFWNHPFPPPLSSFPPPATKGMCNARCFYKWTDLFLSTNAYLYC